MTKPKPASELTTEGALRRLFPREVRAWARDAARASLKPKGGKRK